MSVVPGTIAPPISFIVYWLPAGHVGVAVGVPIGVPVGVALGQPVRLLLSTTLMEVPSELLYPATTTAVCPPAVLTVAASANERAELRVGPVLQLLATGS